MQFKGNQVMDVSVTRTADDYVKAGKSGLLLVSDNDKAFAARVLAARSSVRTLDLMYNLWHDDHTGRMLLRFSVPPSAACVCGCCSMTSIRARTIPHTQRRTAIQTSR